MSIAAVICLVFWSLVVAALAWDEKQRERPRDNDAEARRAFAERLARETAGRE